MSSLRIQIRQFSFVRIVFPFLIGTVAGISIDIKPPLSYFALLIVVSLIFSVVVFNKVIHYKAQKYKGWIVNLLIATMGFISIGLYNEIKSLNHFTQINANSFVVCISGEPIRKGDHLKFEASVIKGSSNGVLLKCSGTLLVTLKNKEDLSYGTYLLINNNYREIDEPKNPYEFDYKRYLGFKNIHFQSYLKENEFKILSKKPKENLTSYSINLRKKCVQLFEEFMPDKQNAQMVGALLLGYRSELDTDVVNAFTNTGTIHILSVSGLHVAIIYIVISFLLKWLDKVKRGNYIKVGLILGLIWFYSLITGLSPAVCRSAFMISVVAVGQGFNKYTNIYNSIAVSIFFLILIDPYLLFDVGFQLSYLAVLGIIYFQPLIYNWFATKNWLLDNIWTMTSVSIAAQLSTFPLSIYYFHQFPNYFLPANLLVIPLASVILYAGILLLFVSPINAVATVLGWALSKVVDLMNLILQKLSSFPFAIIDGLSISNFELLLLTLIIVLIGLLAVVKQKNKTIIGIAFCLMAISSSCLLTCFQSVKQKEMIVFSIRGNSVIAFRDQQKLFLLTDTTLSPNKFNFSVKPYVVNTQVKELNYLSENSTNAHLFKQHNLIQFYNLRLIIINRKFQPHEVSKKLKVDYLLVTGNPKINAEQLIQQFEIRTIIIDNAVSNRFADKFKEECEQLHLNTINVHQSKAIRIPI